MAPVEAESSLAEPAPRVHSGGLPRSVSRPQLMRHFIGFIVLYAPCDRVPRGALLAATWSPLSLECPCGTRQDRTLADPRAHSVRNGPFLFPGLLFPRPSSWLQEKYPSRLVATVPGTHRRGTPIPRCFEVCQRGCSVAAPYEGLAEALTGCVSLARVRLQIDSESRADESHEWAAKREEPDGEREPPASARLSAISAIRETLREGKRGGMVGLPGLEPGTVRL